MAMFYMQYKGREKAAKVVEFVAKWLNLCLSTVCFIVVLIYECFDLCFIEVAIVCNKAKKSQLKWWE